MKSFLVSLKDLDSLVDQLTSGDTCNATNKKEHSKEEKNVTEIKNVGSIVKDKVPKEEIKLVYVPLLKSHNSFNLSDQAFETMGDMVEDSLDTSHAKILTGNFVLYNI